MAEEKQLFKGLRQVSQSFYESQLAISAVSGYIWFVKRTDVTANDGYGEIYFGSRHYGHFGNEAEQIAALSGVVETIKDEIGDLEGHTVAELVSGLTSRIEVLEGIDPITGITLNGSAVTVTDRVAAITVAQDEYNMVKQDDAESGYSATYYLTKNGTQVGAKINITKDQFLKNVEFHKEAEAGVTVEAPYLKFVWQYEISGGTNVTYVPVKDLVKTYEAGTAIEINSANTINVKVAEGSAVTITNKGKNFLKVDNDELRVNGVDADAMVIAKDITIEGGEWATTVKKVYTDGTLPAGETFQEFMQKMLCVEKWGNPTGPTYKFEASIGKPNVYASLTGKVPVGTKVIFSATTGTMTVSNSASVAGYTYGYSLNGTSKTATASSYNANVTTPTQSGDIILSCSVNEYLQEVDESVIGVSGAAKEYYVRKGIGSYTANETGKTVTRGVVTDQDVYNVSNLGNVRDTDKKSITNVGFTGSTEETKTPTAGNSATITGFYPVYYGSSTVVDGDLTGKDPAEVFTEAFIKALANKDKEDVPATSTKIATEGGSLYGGYVVAVPTGHSAYNKTILNMKSTSDASFMGSSNNFTTTINMYNNVESVSYKVFYIANAAKDPNAGEWYMTFE